MTPKGILKTLLAGKTVTYRVRLLWGYIHGYASLVFRPEKAKIGPDSIAHRLKCFRFDEKSYDRPTWTVD